jgi:AraC-like DNA-binding protein
VLRDLDRELEPLERDQFLLALADALLAADTSLAATRDESVDPRAADRARAFLEAQFDRTVHSEELERETGLDRFALARSFRRRFGTSPYRYLTMRRLDRARGAILGGASLADAAQLGGFADQSHMTRQFRRAYGVSPGRWRAMQAASVRI